MPGVTAAATQLFIHLLQVHRDLPGERVGPPEPGAGPGGGLQARHHRQEDRPLLLAGGARGQIQQRHQGGPEIAEDWRVSTGECLSINRNY